MTNLRNFAWGNGPTISGSIAYEWQRSGNDMQYKVQVTVDTLPYSDSSFGYPIYAEVYLDGPMKAATTLKAASPAKWSSALVWTTGWLTVSDKTADTTKLDVRLYSGSGSSRDSTWTDWLWVQPVEPESTDEPSTISASAFTMGESGTITINKKHSHYTHTITYAFGNTSGTITSKTSSVHIDWTPPVTLAKQVPNATYGQGLLFCKTYSGSTLIGETQIKLQLYVPSSVKPSGSLSVTANKGGAPWAGVLVKGYGTLSYSVSASGAQGSTIKSCTFSFGGQSLSGLSGTTAVLGQAGSFTPTATITDSRGRTATITATAQTVYEYSYPSITAATATRTNASGTADESGTYITLNITGSISSVGGKNALTRRYRTRPSGGTWSSWTTITAAVTASGFAATTTYEVELGLIDTVGNARSITKTIPTAKVWIDTLQGNGLGIGKYAETAGIVDSALPVLVRNNITANDYISSKIAVYAGDGHVGAYDTGTADGGCVYMLDKDKAKRVGMNANSGYLRAWFSDADWSNFKSIALVDANGNTTLNGLQVNGFTTITGTLKVDDLPVHPPIKMATTGDFTYTSTGKSLYYTNYSLTAPAAGIMVVRGIISNSGSAPLHARLSLSTKELGWQAREGMNQYTYGGSALICVTGMFHVSAGTKIALWGAWNSAATNYCELRGAFWQAQ